MWRVAARRLLLLPATLLAIALIGFVLIHLLPGDPISARPDLAVAKGLTARDIERLRSTYGLDLPLFLNTDVVDRGRRISRLVRQLAEPGLRQSAEARLREIGTIALPELTGAAGQSPALRLAGDLLGMPAEATAAKVRARYRAWTEATASSVDAFIRNPTDEQAGGLVALGSAVVPLLAEALLRQRGQPGAIASVLARLTAFEGGGNDARARFERWWRVHRLRYVDLSGGSRFWATFTETRLGNWLGRLLRLDLGDSADGRPVSALIGEALPITALLGLLALLVAYAIALPLGALAAGRREGKLDRGTFWMTLLALALPAPWVAVGLVSLVGALPVEIFPLQGLTSPGAQGWGFWARGADLLWHLILPVSCLAYGTAALLLRYQRTSTAEILAEPFITTARAKGLSERRVLFRHGLRASLGPAVAFFSVELPAVLSGSVIVETAFDIPGMGLLTWKALNARDYPTLLGTVVVLAIVASVASALADLVAARLDPRIAEATR